MSALMSDNVARYPGEEMSCKVKLSINWCVGPTLAFGHRPLTVTGGTRLTIQVAGMRLAWLVASEIGQASLEKRFCHLPLEGDSLNGFGIVIKTLD